MFNDWGVYYGVCSWCYCENQWEDDKNEFADSCGYDSVAGEPDYFPTGQ